MIDAPVLFATGNGLALFCWVALIASLFVAPIRSWLWRVTGFAVPALLGLAYIALLATGWGDAPGAGFGSIGAVRALFANDAALTAGWFHYLAFDLFVGTWIAREGLAAGLHPVLLVPCVVLTFMFGPAGLLLFFALRLLPVRGGRS